MNSTTYCTRGRSVRGVPDDTLSGVKRRQHQYRTTAIERLLLMAIAFLIPLRPFLPTMAGFSTEYIMFGILTGYTLLNRPAALARTWSHPVFLAAFVLLIIAALIESAHPFSRYGIIFRMGLMIVAAIVVASLCRDRRALSACIYGYLISGVLISVVLFLTAYGALQGVTATDFSEASNLRSQVYEDVDASPNELAKFAAYGAVMALALGLTARSLWRRNLFFALALFCIVATSLGMSRGAMAVVGVACATVMFAYGVRNVRVILVSTALAMGALMWIPEAAFSRMSFSPETSSGRMESRVHIYKAAIDHLPEYVLTGVGAGNFQGPWGMRTAFYLGGGRTVVHGAHNAFIQVMIFWGIAGLLVLILVIYLAYCCLPRGYGKDALALCVYGIATSLVLGMMFSHGLASKQYSLILGLLVGGHRWIWPKGIILSLRRGQGRRYSAFDHAL